LARSKLDKALDDLYRAEPAEFTKKRDALAKQLLADGDSDGAERVKRLRKPSKAAWVVNALAGSEPKAVKKYMGLADKLRKVTSGEVDAKRMRALAREEGELLEELVDEAGKLSDGASASTLDRVRETLQAAQLDGELRESLLAGRVEREERAASVGLDNLAAAPVAAKRRPKSKAAANADDDAKKAAAKSRKQRAEAEADFKNAEAEARDAEREVARAEAALAKAERSRDRAAEKVERAEAKVAKLRSTS